MSHDTNTGLWYYTNTTHTWTRSLKDICLVRLFKKQITILSCPNQCWTTKVSWLQKPQITTDNLIGFGLVILRLQDLPYMIGKTSPSGPQPPPPYHTYPTRRFAHRHMCVQRFYCQLRPCNEIIDRIFVICNIATGNTGGKKTNTNNMICRHATW